jgi:serine/threonine protein kinase
METQGPLSGQTLGGKYLLGELLGEGGFGAVYRGRHLLLDRPQAIKVLHEHHFRKPKFRERFLREAKMVAALDHHHIVHIDDFGMDEQETRAYLVMPFIDGGTFSKILKEQRQPLPVEQVIFYLEQVCSALDYAHQRGVVHLDLKPPNLLIREDNWLLLSDFGLAHFLKQEGIEGGTSLKFGSPHYMAPEHINGQPNKSSDVYALGVMLFEMLVGQRPFTGTTPEAIMVKHLTESPPLLRSLRPELPIELEEILERALAKQAEQRFRSASALLMAFKGALARVQEQVLKIEEERLRKAEEEQARRAEAEQLRRAKEEQALRAEIERLQKATEEQARKTETGRSSRYTRIFGSHPEAAPPILPLPINQIEGPDLLIEDYNEAQDIRQAASVSFPTVGQTLNEEDQLPAIPERSAPVQGPAADRPSHPSTRPYGVPSRESRYGYTPPTGQTLNEEDQLPAIPERSAPAQGPQAIPLPMPRAQPKPPAPKAPPQKPASGSTTRNGPRTSQAAGSRSASLTTQPRGNTARPSSTTGKTRRQPGARNLSRRSRRLLLVLASIIVLFAIVFGVAYLNTASTVQITVVTQAYPSTVKLILSEKNESGTVHAKLETQAFTKTAPEPTTGTTVQPSGNSTGKVYFTNTGTKDVEIPAQTVVATPQNVQFMTTADVLIAPQTPNTVPLPVPIQAVNPGVSGNVQAGTITVIPQESLTKIAQAPNSTGVTADDLKTTLTVTNLETTTKGEAHDVPAVVQADLDNAKKDLDNQVQTDIDGWLQQQGKKGLVGQPVRVNDALVNPPAPQTPAPDTTFPASISVTVTVLVAPVNDAQSIAQNQLNNTVQTDQKFGPAFAIIGDSQTIKIDLTQQKVSDGNNVTIPVTGKVGPKLNTTDLQNSIKGKSLSEAQAIVRQKSTAIKTVDIQTLPSIFTWVSPWADQINVIIEPAS